MELTNGQIEKLRTAHTALEAVLMEVGALPRPEAAQPKWKEDTRRQWQLLTAVVAANDLRGGDVGADEWTRLGEAHGYDPRGLGGFFQGSEPMMATQGARRVLTEHGLRFIERWRADFEDGR